MAILSQEGIFYFLKKKDAGDYFKSLKLEVEL